MQYATLEGTNLRVSRLCLGTVFRQSADESVYLATIDAALDAGCNFFDTANVYQDGDSERILGQAMKGRRERFIMTTKVGALEADDSSAKGLGADNIVRGCERSLRRLATDVIDFYLCHFPCPDVPIEETLTALDTLVRQGKVRHVGCSNFEAPRLDEALQVSDQRGLTRFVCNQVGYSLLDRRIEQELIPYCAAHSVGITVFAATAIGLLSGRYRYGQSPPAGSSWHRGPYNFRAAMTPRVGQIIDAVIDTADSHGRTPTQVAMAWCLRNSGVGSVIIGSDSPRLVRENLAACDWVLPDDEVRRLNDVSRGEHLEIRKDCPHGYDAPVQREAEQLSR